MIASSDWNKHFIQIANLDLKGIRLSPIGNYPKPFTGVFDGNRHIIRNAGMNMPNSYYVGLFGFLGPNGKIRNIYIVDVVICGDAWVGGLVGSNYATITDCYATGSVSGSFFVGGLAGSNSGLLNTCYSTTSVYGNSSSIGGMVGGKCRSAITDGIVTACFWDVETSGWSTSASGIGKTTTDMKARNTFTDAGWNFVGETENGTEDIWSICEGTNYPRLTWQVPTADFICPDGVGLEDFSYLAQFWIIPEAGNISVDLDKNKVVGITDLMIFCEQWLRGR